MSLGSTSRRLLPRFTALLVGLMCCAPSAAVADKRHSCHPRGSRTEASDARGRVYSVKVDRYGDRSFYGCLYRTGRRRPLGQNPYYDYDHHIARLKLASPFVAYAVTEVSSHSNSDILTRLNLRNGHSRELDELLHYSNECCTGWQVQELRRLLVTSFGAVVWSFDNADASNPLGTVKKFDHAGAATLDSAPGVEPRSVHLSRSGHRVYWIDGTERSAPLR